MRFVTYLCYFESNQLPGLDCRSDVHFWKHGRIGDSMVVSSEVKNIYVMSVHRRSLLREILCSAVLDMKVLVKLLKLARAFHNGNLVSCSCTKTSLTRTHLLHR